MKRTGVLGIFSDPDEAALAIRDLRRRDFRDVVVYSPVPHHQLLQEVQTKTSPVRLWTLVGGVLGCLSGFALTIWTSVDWPHQTSGKPIISIPPFIVIAFELTILFGALATLLGFLFHARLPEVFADSVYDPRFTEDLFGILVRCDANRFTAASEALQLLGAREVRFAES